MDKQFNNYDTNSKGLGIEGYVSYDNQLARDIFEDNFQRIDTENCDYIYKYTEYEQLPVDDFNYYITGTKKQFLQLLLDYKYTSECNYLKKLSKDELYDRVTEILEQNYYRIKECDKIQEACESVGLKYDRNFEIIETRGYSQGDYAQVVVDKEALTKLVGKEPTNEDLKKMFDHYFWDTPITGRVDIENISYYYTEFVEETYQWEREKYIEGVVNCFEGTKKLEIQEQLEELLPIDLEYN